jgi:hypothetical protein
LKNKENNHKGLTEQDELVIRQTKPYLSGSILCCVLSICCLIITGIQPKEPGFWLCVATLLLNFLFITGVYRKTRKIRKP